MMLKLVLNNSYNNAFVVGFVACFGWNPSEFAARLTVNKRSVHSADRNFEKYIEIQKS